MEDLTTEMILNKYDLTGQTDEKSEHSEDTLPDLRPFALDYCEVRRGLFSVDVRTNIGKEPFGVHAGVME